MGKHYYILGCRSTGMGAYTTMHGEKFNFSLTGRHWKERLPVKIGDEVIVTDISNSGKHYCYKIKITAVEPTVQYEIVERADVFCQFCEE